MSKYVGVLIKAMNFILVSAFVGECIDCKNVHGMNSMSWITYKTMGVHCAVGTEFLIVMQVNFLLWNIKKFLGWNPCWTLKIGDGLPALGRV
jgi:hypothetical protein